MKVSIRNYNNEPRLCLETKTGAYDVECFLHRLANFDSSLGNKAQRLLNINWDTTNFLAKAGSWGYLTLANELLSKLLDYNGQHRLTSAKVERNAPFYPPIQQPPLMFGLAGNCPQTWRWKDVQIPNYPIGYTRPWHSLSAHNDRITISEEVTSFRCAAELGIVIGKETYQVSRDNAMDYVFGYTCINDMISNHWKAYAQKCNPSGHPSFIEYFITSYYGRGTDGFAPMGPWIVTKEEIKDPYNLLMYTHKNGEQLDRSYSNCMILSVENTIEYLSSFMPLKPGSIIHMGTMGRDGITIFNNERLQKDDYIEISIEQIGNLRTYFEDRREVENENSLA